MQATLAENILLSRYLMFPVKFISPGGHANHGSTRHAGNKTVPRILGFVPCGFHGAFHAGERAGGEGEPHGGSEDGPADGAEVGAAWDSAEFSRGLDGIGVPRRDAGAVEGPGECTDAS